MRTEERRNAVLRDAIGTLERAILQADLQTGQRILKEIAGAYGYGVLISRVIEPLLTDLGERMKRQEVSLAQSYMVSLIVDDVLHLSQDSSASQERKGPIVLANIEDDCHPLGRKVVSTLLQINHWEICDLGIDVEAAAIVRKAVDIGARVIGVSAMIFTTAENIRKVRRELNAAGQENRIKLAVGGAVFRLRPELAAQVGADGTAPNAFSALGLFEELWQKAEGWT